MFGAALVMALCVLPIATPELPRNFDPQVNMLSEGDTHSTRGSADFAAQLIAEGSPEAIDLAVKVLDAVLQCQELNEKDAHYGNFRWTRENPCAEDLNAVEFTLSHLVPMMLTNGDRVPQPMHDRVIQSIRLGMDEIRCLDVSIAYTNITSLDVFNSCLAGEVLKDNAVSERGKKKLLEWIGFTNTNGTVYEFNSPTYMGVTLGALGKLAQLAPDPADRVRSRTFAARLALGSALHIHPVTGRWAGPHSRAYSYTSFCTDRPEADRFVKWMERGVLPAWLEAAVKSPLPREIRETSGRLFDFTQSTYLADSFALGVASREMIDQSNCFIGHYVRPGKDDTGVILSRYVLNDQPRGEDEGKRQFFEAGRFYGVQDRERAIALYAPQKLFQPIESVKAILVWPKHEASDEIWVGDQQIKDLPATVEPGKVIVVGAGAAWMAVLPLRLHDFGHDAPIRLIEKTGALVLEMHNYLGPQKLLWEMEWPGGFYQGQPQCGFYAEMAARSAYPDGKTFAAAVASGKLKDEAGPARSYAAAGKRLWDVEYARDGRALGIEVDLYQWLIEKRWTDKGEMSWPMLESPVARETSDGKVETGGAKLECGAEAAWIFAAPEKELWVASYLGLQAAPLKFTVPNGSVVVEKMGMGTIVWDKGTVKIDALDISGQPVVTGGKLSS